MRFEPAGIEGAFLVRLDLHRDDRGAFARTFCVDVFREAGIAFDLVQTNISRNPALHTLRGMHVQTAPAEPKLVQCVRGAIFDVAIDLRPNSPTYGQHAVTELSADGDHLFYIPPGCAHGFLTLAPDSDVFYYMGGRFDAGGASGVRWNDPAFAIDWPADPQMISERDARYGDFIPIPAGW